MLRQVKASKNWNIILDCSIDILPAVLIQSQQVGIMSNKHNYIIASLVNKQDFVFHNQNVFTFVQICIETLFWGQDLQTIDLEPFGYGGTNFTGLRLIDPEDTVVNDIFEREKFNLDLYHPTQLTVEAALVYDSVQLFGRALKQLDDAIIANVKTELCDNRNSWEHGSSLMNFMRLVIIFFNNRNRCRQSKPWVRTTSLDK